MSGDEPVRYLALGNSEPLPDDWPPEVVELLRETRRLAGWCDHGNRLGQCSQGCA